MGESRLGKRNIDVVTLFVEDLERTRAFYREVFGLEPFFEDEHSAVFGFGNLSVNLLRISEAPELIAPAAVAPGESGSRFMFTIGVDDADAVHAELIRRGASVLNGPTDRPWGVRTVCFADPGGHMWEVAQQLGNG